MTWQTKYASPEPKRYIAIRCFDCKEFIPSKGQLKYHKNHDVHYTDREGNIND